MKEGPAQRRTPGQAGQAWGGGDREREGNLPFPEVRVGGGRKAGSEASAETLARVGGSVNCW